MADEIRDTGEQKTVDQKEIDRVVQERLARQKEKLVPESVARGRRELAEELGIDLAEVESARERLGRTKADESESAKLAKLLKKTESERADMAKQLDTYKKQVESHTISTALDAHLTGVIDPVLAKRFLQDLVKIEDSHVTGVNGEKLEDVVKEFLKDRQYLLRATIVGPGSGSKQSETKQQYDPMNPQHRLKALADFMKGK